MASRFNLTPSAMEALARHYHEVTNETSSANNNNRQSPSPVMPFVGTRSQANNSDRNGGQQSSSSSNVAPSTAMRGLSLQQVKVDTDLAETQIEKTLELPATISKYIDEEKYEEAYGLVKKLYKLGAAVNFISVLVNFYVSLTQTDRPEKACKVKNEILATLRDNLEPDPVDIQNYGLRLQRKKRYSEAILFFQLAGNLHLTDSDNETEATNGIGVCIMGQRQATIELLQTKSASKLLIKKHVIPEMHNLKNKATKLSNVDKRQTCVMEALWLHHIEVCEGLVGNIEGRIATIKEATQKMRKVFNNEAAKFQLFSIHLHNLGTSYLLSNRFAEAKETLSEAVSAMRKAEDYATESERRKDLLRAETCLKSACDQLRSNQ